MAGVTRELTFDPEDFASLALSLRQTVINHGVPPRLRASLIEDVVFQFAAFVDEKTGGAIHESIFPVLRKYGRQLGEAPAPVDSLLAEVEITFFKGRKAELNVLRSGMARPKLLRQVLEIALGLRDTSQLKARVDINRRFGELMKKNGGVKALRFRMDGPAGDRSWRRVRLTGSAHGDFEQSVEGLLNCIRTIVISP